MNSTDILNELTKDELICMIKNRLFFRENDIKHGCVEALLNRMDKVNNEPNPYEDWKDYKGFMLKMEWDKKQQEKWNKIDKKVRTLTGR